MSIHVNMKIRSPDWLTLSQRVQGVKPFDKLTALSKVEGDSRVQVKGTKEEQPWIV